MKRILAILCALAMLLSVLPSAAFAAENSDLQVAMDDDSSEIIVLEEDTSNLTVNRDTTIDLNGYDLDGVSVTGGTLYIMDSATADYTVADGIYGHVTDVTGNVKAAEGYLQVGDSFHAVNLDIYAMTLRAADVGVYYKSHFAADEIVAAEVESFGVALSVVTAPSASNLETYCGYSQFNGFEAGEGANSVGTSTLLKGIMKAANGDEKNAKNAAMPVYGRAYIKTSEGYFFGETVKRSLQAQVEAIDGVWETLSDAQKAPVLSMLEAYTSVMENWEIPNIQGIQLPDADEEIEIPIEVTAENGVVTETVTVEENGVSITVPAGTKLAEGAESLTLTITPVEAEDTGLTLKENYVLTPMDVHVEGLAADNTQPLTIYLGKIMPENLNMGNYAVYHVENGNANEMTLIPATAEFTAHNQYKYTLDGELTLYMASFSVIAAEVDEENTWNGSRDYSWYNADAETLYIRNADQLAGFGAIVGGMDGQEQDSFSGKTVILLADINIGDLSSENGYVFYPIGYYNDYGGFVRVAGVTVNSWFNPFAGTFDGNGNTISDFYQNTWEMFGDYNDGYGGTPNYYRDGMGLFGKVYGGTIKNLIVRNYSCDSEHGTSGTVAAYADCGATFENIAIFDCNPRVYNIANGGIVGCVGWYAKESATKKVTFKNITVDNSNTIAALWDATGTSAGGILGQYYPVSGQTSAGKPANPGVHFDSCRVSAVIEVNNDCCSNYHYYWYRYAGMLMGSVRANKVDEKTGHTMADTTGITAANCEVNYGYWNEYWYCELVKNTIASYTHDHQFGRLTSITDISQISADGGETWLKEGNFALLDKDRNCVDCYHIFRNSNGELYRHYHDQPDETNPNIYEDFDLNGDGQLNDLKEDRQRYFIPFGQLLTGDGMGILAHYEFEGVTVKEKDQNGILLSQEKFRASAQLRAGAYPAGANIKIGDLFAEVESPAAVVSTNVQVTVSPADKDSTVTGTYTANTADWLSGTLKFSGEGKAKVTITDYYYCKPLTLTVNVTKYTADLYFEDLENKTAYCPVCGDVKTWTDFTPYLGVSLVNNGVNHYYLSKSLTYSAGKTAVNYDFYRSTVCLHLNGNDLRNTNYTAIYAGDDLNVMGSGKVSGGRTTSGRAATIETNSSNGLINIYGGTWEKESTTANPIVAIVGGKSQGVINLYADAVVDCRGANGEAVVARSGNINFHGASIYGGTETCVKAMSISATSNSVTTVYTGTINVYDGLIQAGENAAAIDVSATTKNTAINIYGGEIIGAVNAKPSCSTMISGAPKINWLTVSDGATVNLGQLTDGAKIGVSATLDEPFTAANVNAENYRKYFYSVEDNSIVAVDGEQLVCKVPTYTDNLEFKADGKTAWCVKCGKLVEWTAITQEKHGDLYFGDGGPNPLYSESYHFYLKEDFVYNNSHSSFLTAPGSPRTCCFHLNGHDMSTSKNTGLFFGWPGTLNIMGNGTVTGNKTKPTSNYSGASVGINTNNANGVINLYSGTYTAVEGNKNSIVAINENGGAINIYEDVMILPVYENSPAISIHEAKARNAHLKIEGADLTGVWLKTQTPKTYTSTVELIDATLGKLTVAQGVDVIISGNTTVTLELAAGASHTITVGGSQQVIDATENMQVIQIRNGAIVTED